VNRVRHLVLIEQNVMLTVEMRVWIAHAVVSPTD
jgi:hypothetical protein